MWSTPDAAEHCEVFGGGRSQYVMEVIRIGALYAIDTRLRDHTPEARGCARQRELAPPLTALKTRLLDRQAKTMAGSGLARAIDYTLKHWDVLARVADDGHYLIDSNAAENTIRPIAIGCKNWLFAGSETAGKRAAAIMSLIATARANGIEPHAWFTNVFTHLPTAKDSHLNSLLPISGYRSFT